MRPTAPDDRPVVVIAPDTFRGSLTAAEAAAAIGDGLRDAYGDRGLDLRLRPVSDGGEGLVDAAVSAGFTAVERQVTGPLGTPVRSRYAVGADPADGTRTAVVELAAASGHAQLPGGRGTPETALVATTRGTGELVRAALDDEVQRVVLGVGGSATTDGGTGLAAALGARFLDAAGEEIGPGGQALRDLDRVDLAGLDPRLRDVELVLATDVDNPLTGEHGAARVFAAQKGAGPAEVELLDQALRNLADALRRGSNGVDGADVEHRPGAGAAGGTGAVAMGLLGAVRRPGIDVVLDLVGFDEAVVGADLVVTGEGSFDGQSLAGKAPVGVADRARRAGVPVVVLAGRVRLDDVQRQAVRRRGVLAVHGLTDGAPGPALTEDDAVRDAATHLRRLAATVVPPVLAALLEPATGADQKERVP